MALLLPPRRMVAFTAAGTPRHGPPRDATAGSMAGWPLPPSTARVSVWYRSAIAKWRCLPWPTPVKRRLAPCVCLSCQEMCNVLPRPAVSIAAAPFTRSDSVEQTGSSLGGEQGSKGGRRVSHWLGHRAKRAGDPYTSAC